MRCRSRAAATALALAIVSPGLTAQTSTSTDADSAAPAQAKELETVVVRSTRDEDERSESTASKTVVSKEELTRYGDTSVVDVLKRLPGVTITGTPGRGSGAEIRMRGLGRGYTSIMLNGERLPPGFSLDSAVARHGGAHRGLQVRDRRQEHTGHGRRHQHRAQTSDPACTAGVQGLRQPRTRRPFCLGRRAVRRQGGQAVVFAGCGVPA
jgi:hypothetical protein